MFGDAEKKERHLERDNISVYIYDLWGFKEGKTFGCFLALN